MGTYNDCVAIQTDAVLNQINQPEDFLDGKSWDAIYEEYGNKLNLTNCDFAKILVDDIPQGTGLTFIAIARAVVAFPE